jgi:hypothetical protein
MSYMVAQAMALLPRFAGCTSNAFERHGSLGYECTQEKLALPAGNHDPLVRHARHVRYNPTSTMLFASVLPEFWRVIFRPAMQNSPPSAPENTGKTAKAANRFVRARQESHFSCETHLFVRETLSQFLGNSRAQRANRSRTIPGIYFCEAAFRASFARATLRDTMLCEIRHAVRKIKWQNCAHPER